jgi:hypothetical protein
MRISLSRVVLLSLVVLAPCAAHAAELVSLTPGNYDEFVPAGKEIDAIYGDYALRNEEIVAVIADPIPSRKANMMIRFSGGQLIDLSTRRLQSDQLGSLYVGPVRMAYDFVSAAVDGATVPTPDRYAVALRGGRVALTVANAATESYPASTVTYSIADGEPYITIETVFTNDTTAPMTLVLQDHVRMDHSADKTAISKATDEVADRFWLYDPWFGQAYTIVAEGLPIAAKTGADNRAASVLRYEPGTPDGGVALAPGETYRLVRYVIPGITLLESNAVANRLKGVDQGRVTFHVHDTSGQALPDAEIEILSGGASAGFGRTRADGSLTFALPHGAYTARVSSIGSGEAEVSVNPVNADEYAVTLPAAGRVIADIRDDRGARVPCKIQFYGRDGTKDPFFGPDSGIYAIHNVVYTPDGRAERPIPPGRYEVFISYGPEYDAIVETVDVRQGEDTHIVGRIKRVVNTTGWISAEYHSHSSPSGDNTSSQRGRVLNLLAEHIEFAPATEHQRVDSYIEHLRYFGATELMATTTGMELTGSPGDLNHQNAFPLDWIPRTQDGGAPETDISPEVQIERLKMWNGGRDKIVQQNHPDMVRMFFDADNDGNRDRGHPRMISFMDCIEIHPIQAVFWYPFTEKRRPGANPDAVTRNNISTWLQMWNMGTGIPGVVNTDAHWNFHGSGWWRNYVASSTDDPAQISVDEMIAATRAGRVVMTNGPYLEAEVVSDLPSDATRGSAGQTVIAPGGRAHVRIRVQCANWLDIDRVQVLVNGRFDPELNFTRAANAELFRDGVVKFEGAFPLVLAQDAHIVVVVANENDGLGLVYGNNRGSANPIAMNNPIFIDTDGNGFTPSGDLIGHQLVPPPARR